ARGGARPSRNFLFNHLGLNEDAKIYLRPDCADLPYTLRAYFAYKMGLPFGFSKCSRGGGGRAPTCPQWFSLQNAEEAKTPPPPPVAAPIPPAVSGYFGFSSAPAPLAPLAPKRTGPAPSFANWCRSSGTASIPAPGAPRSPTTTPITIRCRS